jgi:hypothetical protein
MASLSDLGCRVSPQPAKKSKCRQLAFPCDTFVIFFYASMRCRQTPTRVAHNCKLDFFAVKVDSLADLKFVLGHLSVSASRRDQGVG